MPVWMPIILGGLLVWNLATDWVWIGNSLNFLPSSWQKDLQNRARSIIDLMNAAKSIVYTAQKDKRKLTAGEVALLRQNADTAEKQIEELKIVYEKKFISFGAVKSLEGMYNTIKILRLSLADFRATAGIATRAAVTAAKVEASVAAVHDGDTLTLDNNEVVRLVGIDAPESTTEAGQASKKFLISLVLGKRVTVESDPTKLKDMYGRRLGVITLAGVNINIEMLKKAHAIFYPYEPNALVFDKVWKAAAEEGKQVMIAGPLTDLKVMRSFSYEKLRFWKSDERAAQKATINEEKERYKSEQYEDLEELKDDYALTKETNKDQHSAILSAIRDAKRAKEITAEEAARRRAAETTRYREVRTKASANYREAKKGVRDPFKKEKRALSALLRTKYREINTIYMTKRREILTEYNANVKAVKLRMKLPYAPEAKMPPSIAPPIYVPPELPVVAPPVVAPPVVAPPVVKPPVVAPPVVTPPVVVTPPAYFKIVTAGPVGARFRNGPGTQYAIRYSVAAGPKFSAVGVVTGEMVSGENRWWKISDGTFMWVGNSIEKP